MIVSLTTKMMMSLTRHDFDQGGDLVQGEGMVLNAWENVAVQLPTVKDLVMIKMIKMLKMMIRS